MPFVLWSAIITASFSIVLGTIAFVKNPRSVANRSFALFNFALAAWTPTDLIKYIVDPHTALIVYRLCYIGGSFITFAFLTFMWEIAAYKRVWVFRFTKWAAIAFAIFSQTDLMIKSIQFKVGDNSPIEETHGLFYNAFIVFFVISLIAAVLPLILGYRRFSGTQKKQVQHVMAAFALGFVAVINFFGNQMNDKIPPVFYLFMMGMCATYATAIMQHRLMDITVIVRKTLIYSAVTGALTVMYLAAISIFAHLFEGFSGYQTIFSSTVAAGLIAFCFHPLRKRVQSVVDGKFFRQYVDREEKLYELSREVITHTTPEAMAQALMRVLQESFHPKIGALYLKTKEGGIYTPAVTWGEVQCPSMSEDNALATYFVDHPQPFVQDLSGSKGESQDTREVPHKERHAL